MLFLVNFGFFILLLRYRHFQQFALLIFNFFNCILKFIRQILKMACDGDDQAWIHLNVREIFIMILLWRKNNDFLYLFPNFVLFEYCIYHFWGSFSANDYQHVIFHRITVKGFCKFRDRIEWYKTIVAEMGKALLIFGVFLVVDVDIDPKPSIKPLWIIWCAVFTRF